MPATSDTQILVSDLHFGLGFADCIVHALPTVSFSFCCNDSCQLSVGCRADNCCVPHVTANVSVGEDATVDTYAMEHKARTNETI